MSVFNREGKFFRGTVVFEGMGLFRSTYRIPTSDAVVKIKNSGHVRMVRGREIPRGEFEVIAPLSDVKIVSGDIPHWYINTIHGREYLEIQQRYQR